MPKTPTEALVDVNVLVAAVFSDHSFHDRARIFVEQLEQIYTSPTIQGGFFTICDKTLEGCSEAGATPATYNGRSARNLAKVSADSRSCIPGRRRKLRRCSAEESARSSAMDRRLFILSGEETQSDARFVG